MIGRADRAISFALGACFMVTATGPRTQASSQAASPVPTRGRVTGVVSSLPEHRVVLVKVGLFSLTGAELDAVPRGAFVVDVREQAAQANSDKSGTFEFDAVAPGLYGIGVRNSGSASPDKISLLERRVRRRVSMMSTEEKEVGTPAVFKLAPGEVLELGALWPQP